LESQLPGCCRCLASSLNVDLEIVLGLGVKACKEERLKITRRKGVVLEAKGTRGSDP
jgi:hypothetical protein